MHVERREENACQCVWVQPNELKELARQVQVKIHLTCSFPNAPPRTVPDCTNSPRDHKIIVKLAAEYRQPSAKRFAPSHVPATGDHPRIINYH